MHGIIKSIIYSWYTYTSELILQKVMLIILACKAWKSTSLAILSTSTEAIRRRYLAQKYSNIPSLWFTPTETPPVNWSPSLPKRKRWTWHKSARLRTSHKGGNTDAIPLAAVRADGIAAVQVPFIVDVSCLMFIWMMDSKIVVCSVN